MKRRRRLLKKLRGHASRQAPRARQRQAARNLVPGRGAHRPERHTDPDLGKTRIATARAARYALRMGLHLRRRLPRSQTRRRPSSCPTPTPKRSMPIWPKSHVASPRAAHAALVLDGAGWHVAGELVQSPTTSRWFTCRPTRRNSTRSKTSGSICATTSSPSPSTKPTKTSSTSHAKLGCSSPTTKTASLQSQPEIGRGQSLTPLV